MRADRLVAALLLLQARTRVTAAELARELEISIKTARRDLEALAVAGIPVYAQAGKGGGWSMLGGARTDLTGLTAAEARTLFLVAGPSATVAPKAKAALRKLVQALPETFRADAEAAASAVIRDPAPWGRRAAAASPHLEPLQRAVIDGVQVRLRYADRTRSETERAVHPLGLVEKGAVWYLVAGTVAGLRTFRLSRIRSVEPTADRTVRPADFDLDETWRGVVQQMEDRRSFVHAVLRVAGESERWLRLQFGDDLTGSETLADGRIEVRVRADNAAAIARRLAGWGRHLEVVEPPDVRDHLARIGGELAALYGPPAALRLANQESVKSRSLSPSLRPHRDAGI